MVESNNSNDNQTTGVGGGSDNNNKSNPRHSSSALSPSTSSSLSSWRNVWDAADRLEAISDTFYPDVTPRIIQLLRSLASKYDGDPEWRSILDKRSLYHELEESIVALHYFLENCCSCDNNNNDNNNNINNNNGIVVVDACAGKGLFSFLLAYLVTSPSQVSQIILLEKATNINWHHIDVANNPPDDDDDDNNYQHSRPPISIWSGTNLHDYDTILQRLLDFNKPIAMVGIHLCKQLSPTFCSLVNGLGDSCIYACLAPCCLPRAVTTQKHKGKKNKKDSTSKSQQQQYTLSIRLAETPQQRTARLEYMERRERTKRKSSVGGPCFLCHDPNHNIKDCLVLPTLPKEDQITIAQNYHKATIPCWNCTQIGHYKNDCPNPIERSNPISLSPPCHEIDVSNVLMTTDPFATYCHLLANEGLQQQHKQPPKNKEQNDDDDKEEEGEHRRDYTSSSSSSNLRSWTQRQVIEAYLVKDASSSSNHHHHYDNNNNASKNNTSDHNNHNDSNWNARRKSIFIVASKKQKQSIKQVVSDVS